MLKKILVNSQDRLSGTPREFNIKLPIRNTKKIDTLMVSKAFIPNTWFNIRNKAIIFYNTVSKTEFSIDISDGNYTITSLLTKINTTMGSLNGGISFHSTTLTFDDLTSTIRLWNSKGVIPYDTINAVSSNSIFKFLNFSGYLQLVVSATPEAFVLSTSGFVNISPNNFLMIKSSALRFQETFEPESTNPNDFNSVLATIPITNNFGEVIVYSNTDTENMIKYSSFIPNQIDIKLCFYNNEPVFINTEWSFELLIRYE